MSEEAAIPVLFVPGRISAREHCHDRIEPLTKHPANPVLKSDQPWEGPGVYYPCVLHSREEKLFRMWYYSELPTDRKQANQPLIDNAQVNWRTFLCYACSTDGVRWEKPNLGKVEFQGNRNNNILLTDSGFFMGTVTVIDDPIEKNPNRRFKLLMYDNDGTRNGIRTAVSPDGIDWKFIGGFPALPSQDTPSLWHDRGRGRYVAFLKDRIDNRRARMMSYSTDFENWSDPAVCLPLDAGDPPTLEFYAQSAFHHGGQDFGFLNRYEVATQKLDLELVASPQGLDWQRLPSRVSILGPGSPGTWDSGMILNGFGEPLTVGNQCWYYYYGSNGRHDEHSGAGAVGIATFTPGRLVGQQFVDTGFFSTIPFRCPGGSLTLDAVARKPLRVEITTTGYGGPIAGFTRDECHPVEGDNQHHAITWKDKSNLDRLKGQFIRLHVSGADSIVYGAVFSRS